jgi:hypothetical protein
LFSVRFFVAVVTDGSTTKGYGSGEECGS